MKSSLLLCSLVALASTVCLADPKDAPDEVLAKVNGEFITLPQVRMLTARFENQINAALQGAKRIEMIQEIRQRTVNELVDRQLIRQEFRKLKVEIPPELRKEVAQRILARFTGICTADLKSGNALEHLIQLVEEEAMVRMVLWREGEPSITAERVGNFYREHREEWIVGGGVKLRVIKRMAGKDRAKESKVLQEVRDKVVQGADFGSLAQDFSQDRSSEDHGDWGWVNRGDMNPTFERVVFGLEPGKVSDVVTMDGAVYLFLVEAKREGVARPLDEVQASIEQRLIHEEMEMTRREWLRKLREKAEIGIY
jgi:parvulin-like peptidyl-prolyl isomerase